MTVLLGLPLDDETQALEYVLRPLVEKHGYSKVATIARRISSLKEAEERSFWERFTRDQDARNARSSTMLGQIGDLEKLGKM